jgi:hypothetical protein
MVSVSERLLRRRVRHDLLCGNIQCQRVEPDTSSSLRDNQ